jgi:hypothetical protein
MGVDGTWWYLVEEEDLEQERSRQLRFSAGSLLSGRTDERIGVYSVDGDELTILLRDGSRVVATMHPFNPTMISGDYLEGAGADMLRVPVTLLLIDGAVTPAVRRTPKLFARFLHLLRGFR